MGVNADSTVHISIHASTQEATAFAEHPELMPGNFNPRLHAGGDFFRSFSCS